MTTAHRATWKAARGGLQEEGSFRLHAPSAAVSAKDAPTERELKRRFQPEEDFSRDTLRARIQGKDDEITPNETPKQLPKRPRRSRFSLGDNSPDELDRNKEETDDKAPHVGSEEPTEKEVSEENEENEIEPNRSVEKEQKSGNDSISDSEDDDEEDDSEDEAELLAELEKIRKERELERIKKQEEEREEREREELSRVASGNPLLRNLNQFHDEISDTASLATGSMPAFAVRRRWDDDVIFKNQARRERKVTQRFVNDTIRNDYHRSFMKRFMG